MSTHQMQVNTHLFAKRATAEQAYSKTSFVITESFILYMLSNLLTGSAWAHVFLSGHTI